MVSKILLCVVVALFVALCCVCFVFMVVSWAPLLVFLCCLVLILLVCIFSLWALNKKFCLSKKKKIDPVVDDDLECTSSHLQPNDLTHDVCLNLYLHFFSLLYISCSKTCYCLYISFNLQPKSNTRIRSLLHSHIKNVYDFQTSP
jgi:hypothetical protein